jgi:hypothetical protein
MYSVKSKKIAMKGTLSSLKKRLRNGDTSAKKPYDAVERRYQLFCRDWNIDIGWLASFARRSTRSKVEQKIREELRLADAIEKEFEKLEEDMQEVRLLEYARVGKLSSIERKIYFKNRLNFTTEIAPVNRATKVLGWTGIILYIVLIAFYVTLFGVSNGAQTTNAWLFGFFMYMFQDVVLYQPVKILFTSVYLPGLISKKLASIADPNAYNFNFDSFMPESAAVYVAMNHEYLRASKLILNREEETESGQQAAAEKEKEKETEQGGTKGPGAENTLKLYVSKGLAKFGLCFFAPFILLPDSTQVILLFVFVPIGVSSVIYGNYTLWQLSKWRAFTVNVLAIAFVAGGLWRSGGGRCFSGRSRKIRDEGLIYSPTNNGPADPSVLPLGEPQVNGGDGGGE